MSYYFNDNFSQLPIKAWHLLLDKALAKATHLEVCRSFSKCSLTAAFATAIVPLPEGINRPYAATHRFTLTPEVVAEVKSKNYEDWNDYNLEDPAFYQDELLLLGTISHEDYVVMQLDENDKTELNNWGFDFVLE